MSLRLTRDGQRLRSMFLQVDANLCSSSPSRGYSLPLAYQSRLRPPWRVGVRTDGSFADTRRWLGHTQAGEKLNFEVTLKGKLGTSAAVGTIRVSGPISDASGKVIDRCDSGTARWTLNRGDTYGGGVHAGPKIDRTAVSIRVARDHARLKSFFVDLVFDCDSNNVLFSLKHLAIAVRRDGTISKRGYALIPFKTPQGDSVSGQYVIRGKLGARLASGTYRAFGTVLTTDGSRVHCDSGAVRWTARRG